MSQDAEDTADLPESNSADAEETEDSADSEESAAPKTPMQKLNELAEKACRLLTAPRDRFNAGVADHTQALSAATRPMPAATVGSLALGLPHAHPGHPPFVPLLPVGPAILGFSNDVLINGMPALVNGALGVNPTCCGLAPFYEVFTGSSKVLIGGERAVRVLDLTFHCATAAGKTKTEALAMARLRKTLHAADHALHVAHKVEDEADFAVLRAEATSAARESVTSASPAVRKAAVESTAMAMTSPLLEQAQDQLSLALAKLMGRDPATPAGTPGAIATGSANVLIGGFPMPGGSAVVRGLLRLLP